MDIRSFFRRGWAGLLLCLGLAASAAAQNPNSPSADQGEYQILHARYGTASRNVDVTQRLRELARQDRNFRMGNDSFSVDPAPNEVKVLRIFARARNGEMRRFEYPEGSTIDGALFTGWGRADWGYGRWAGGWGGGDEAGQAGLQILQARYGTAKRNVDVTSRLKDLARREGSFVADNNSLGVDPDPDQVKTLRIIARGPDGQIRTFDHVEGSVVAGTEFSGWASGAWGRSGDYRGGWSGSTAGARPGRVAIVSARYGAGNSQGDVTRLVRDRLIDGRLDLTVDNATMGGLDPAPNRSKTLVVTYTVDGGRQQQARVDENGRLSLP